MEIVSFHFCPLRAVEIFNVTVFTRVETEYLLSWNEIFFFVGTEYFLSWNKIFFELEQNIF